MAVSTLPDLNVLPAEALRALILVQHQQLLSTDDKLTATQEQLLSREREIEHLKLLLVKLHRMQFGRKSEKLERQIEQLELRLEELEANRGEKEPTLPELASPPASTTPAKPTRRALPDHLPRETRTHTPKETVCPQCRGELRKLGEDVSEVLEYVPASFRVIRHVRTKLSCTKCDCIVQAQAPGRPSAQMPRLHCSRGWVNNVAFRKQKAAEYGIGFELPNLVSIVPNNSAKTKTKKAA